jgi:kynurenine formamidase
LSDHPEAGPAADRTPQDVLAALALPRAGEVVSLALPRFPGMPLFPSHPPFQVSMSRTPAGIRGDGAQPWGPGNEVGLGYMAEVVSATSHSGAHVDALAHITIGEDDHWYCGNAREHLGDRGPTRGDASKLPTFITRGVLLDVPAFRGLDVLPAHDAVTADELAAVAEHQGVAVRPGDVVLVRTGLLSRWPDPARLAEHAGAGPDVGAARWMLEQGAVAVGSDTDSFEVQPAPDPGSPANPQPVHTLLLVEHAVYIMESLYLEDLAARQAHEFLFVALPVKIRGATGSMVDPVAIL